MNDAPSTNGSNGRDERGRFARGNAGGPGNPQACKVARLRHALLKAVTAKDIREIAQAMIVKAKGGDTVAAREILDRVLGKPGPAPEPSTHDTDKRPCNVFVTFPEDRRGPAEVAAAQAQQPSSTRSAATA